MYHVHSVRAFVHRSLPRGEADATLELVVDGLGFVRAIAKGVRFAKSKSRYACVEGSFVECELVRGKEAWRMIKARVAADAPAGASRFSIDARRALARTSRLVATVCDEDASGGPYRALASMAASLAAGADPVDAEALATARVLAALGYLDDTALPFLADGFDDVEALAAAAVEREALVRAINLAIRAATS